MQYKDLLQFEPIETVIQLKDANQVDRAFHLLDTYVISDRMAEQLNELIINQLQFNRPADNKGLLVVGNYGTGKSHLMSVISTIAEREGASAHITNPEVAEKAKEIEGQFKVIRLEIGSVNTSLRDILCMAIEDGLAEMEITYSFPSEDQKIINNKDSLEEMMGLFNEQFPDHGLLVVVDELLDYLRGRKEQELTLDLGFLREVGEICSKTRFRFVAGIQEMLFDNPRFNYVADPLRRVKERFEQVRIVREDIAYVVSERLLKKTDQQKALIREHLSQFTTLYNRLNEEMETYVNLFPIHPAYLTAFEKVNVAEKRVALKTISIEINKIINDSVSEESPGLISYDNYWRFIEEDSSYKSNPDIKEVLDKSKILKDRIQNAFGKKMYQPMALRIVNALAVYRLSTSDIFDKVGLTAEELRDDLFLHPTTGMDFLLEDDEPAEFLKTSVEAALKEIQKTVSYQYLSTNETNGQYYLDLKKDIDVESLIKQQAETIEDDKLDRYYFDILKQAITLEDNTYISGFKIWRHQLPWESRRVTREGYLFFGAPNERSTAQPERDFYLYMLRPYMQTPFKDEQKADEVFFDYNRSDEAFDNLLKLYAAARDLAVTATSSTKSLYVRKAESYFKDLIKWLNKNFVHTFEITYKGKKGSVLEFGIFLQPDATIQEIINTVAEGLLTDWFEQKYADYPIFSQVQGSYISRSNMETYIKDALQYLTGKETRQGAAILNGLVLLDSSNKLNPRKSGYANWIIELLNSKGHSQVINHGELVETVLIKGMEDLQYTKNFRMEPEFLVVLIGALVSSGDIEVSIDGKTYNALNLNELISLPINRLKQFNYIKKPSGLPIAELNAIFDLFDVRVPNFEDAMLSKAIVTTTERANESINETLRVIQLVKKGFPTWDGPLLSTTEIQENTQMLEQFKDFCEGLKRFNTPAKMRNLKYDLETIEAQQKAIDVLKELSDLDKKIKEIEQQVSYLRIAHANIGMQSEWGQKLDEVLEELFYALKQHKDSAQYLMQLTELKEDYIKIYIQAHDRSRLNANEEILKNKLLGSPEFKALKELSTHISILPNEQFVTWQRSIESLKACYHVSESNLQHSPICNHCKFRIAEAAENEKDKLKYLQNELDTIFENWKETLLSNLNDETVKENINLLQPKQRELVESFINTQEFLLPIDIRLTHAINDLLKGIEKVEITFSELEDMMANGNPLTVEEFRKRFEELISNSVGNGSSNRVRIMLKR